MDSWLQFSQEDPFVPLQGYLSRPRLSTEIVNISVQFVDSTSENTDNGPPGDINHQDRSLAVTNISRCGSIRPFYPPNSNVARALERQRGKFSHELAYAPSARLSIRTLDLVPYNYPSDPTKSHGGSIGYGSGSSRVNDLSSGVPSRIENNNGKKNNPRKRGRDNNNGEDRGDTEFVELGGLSGGVQICPYQDYEHRLGKEYYCGEKQFQNFDAKL